MSGYIGPAPVPQATQTRQTFTATSGQTSFATIGYVAGGQFIQVYLNGVLLKLTDDYTAANGSDIVLTSGAATGDILEFITFADFTVNNQNFTGDLTVDTDTLYVDSANNRVGIGNASPTQALDVTGDIITSGGVYLGGTGSANLLSSYEEGTFTLRVADAGSGGNVSSTTGTGYYIKVGRNVTIHAAIGNISTSGLTSGNVASFTGLPFTCDASGTGSHGTVRADSINFQASNSYLVCQVGDNSTSLIIKQINDNGLDTNTTVGDITSGVADVSFTITYRT